MLERSLVFVCLVLWVFFFAVHTANVCVCVMCISSFLYFIHRILRVFLFSFLVFFIHFSYLSLCALCMHASIYRSPLKAWMRFKLVRLIALLVYSFIRLCVRSYIHKFTYTFGCVSVCTFHFTKCIWILFQQLIKLLRMSLSKWHCMRQGSNDQCKCKTDCTANVQLDGHGINGYFHVALTYGNR